MKLADWWHNQSGRAKAVAVLSVTFCIGVGLCALDFQLGAHGYGRNPGNGIAVGPLDGVSLLVMFLSAAGLAITFIMWLVTALVRAFTSGAGER
jgi:hypothetical protein